MYPSPRVDGSRSLIVSPSLFQPFRRPFLGLSMLLLTLAVQHSEDQTLDRPAELTLSRLY